MNTVAPEAERFYRTSLGALERSGVPFLMGGAYALHEYTGIVRDTKDLDVFCKHDNAPALLATLQAAGYETVVAHPLWLGKAFCGDHLVDLIFGSGNGICTVDDGWFRHAIPCTAFGMSVRLIPPEEMIWSKSYVQDRERFDGADIAHIIRGRGRTLDWHRLLARMAGDWEILLAHLLMFRFAYPSERDTVPAWLLRELGARIRAQIATPPPPGRLCQGTLLSPYNYEIDVNEWGYEDARRRRSDGPVWRPEAERAHRGGR